MEADIYLNTTERALRATLTGRAEPTLKAKLQAALTVNVLPFADGDTVAALIAGSPTFRAVIKKDPTDTGYVFTSTVTENDDEDGYVVTWSSVDSADLRTDLGDLPELDAVFEFEWTVGDVTERATCPVKIENAWIRTDQEPPAAGADWAVRFDEAQTLTDAEAAQALANMKVTITAGGYLRMVNSAGNVFHIGMNSGEPPA